MKAVIVEIKGEYAAALSSDGSVLKVEDKGYRVGEQIDVPRPASGSERRMRRLITRAASAVAVAAACAVGGLMYFTPYSYVTLDVNPSISYTLNRFDIVLAMQALNDDGVSIVEGVQSEGVLHRRIDEAVEKTLEQLDNEQYFSDDENYVVLTASADDTARADELAGSLKTDIEAAETANAEAERAALTVQSVSVTSQQREQAAALGVSVGKLYIVEELGAAMQGEEFDPSDWLDKPVRDVMHAIGDRRPAGSPADGSPADGGLADGNPADGSPAGSNPAGGNPAGGSPAGGSPAGGSPADGNPAGGNPANGSPADGSPADGNPAGSNPANGSPADGSPVDSPAGSSGGSTPPGVPPSPPANGEIQSGQVPPSSNSIASGTSLAPPSVPSGGTGSSAPPPQGAPQNGTQGGSPRRR